MLQELNFMTEILDKKGVKVGDLLVIKPFNGKKRNVKLMRTQYDFVSVHKTPSATMKVLGSVQGEKLHFQLQLNQTQGLNKKYHDRYMLKSLCGVPFKLNGNWVLESFLEIGDICELGYHKIMFDFPKNSTDEFKLSKEIFAQNKKIIHSQLPILLEGETGVGKTSLAKELHNESRGKGNFIHLNISSLSKSLLESELFGHVKGSFTGANQDKPGALKLSHGGTLFLDEVDSLPIEIQTKLLIFLDEQKIRPVGGVLETHVNTRIICASGKNLKTMVERGLMRQDFYFRIASGLVIKLTSLRDEPEKVEKFCHLFSIQRQVGFSSKLIEFYQSLPWPGNLRQLQGHLEKKLLTTNGTKLIFDEHDDELLKLSSSLNDLQEVAEKPTLKEMKINYVKKIYFECNKNAALASKKLGISNKVLKRLIVENAA
jgi:transcriptional regulator of acetoin/glycerol metabolism